MCRVVALVEPVADRGRSAPDPCLAPRGPGWVGAVNGAMSESEAAAIRESIRRDRPFGSDLWVRRTADDLGLGSGPRDRGRPRIRVEDQGGGMPTQTP